MVWYCCFVYLLDDFVLFYCVVSVFFLFECCSVLILVCVISLCLFGLFLIMLVFLVYVKMLLDVMLLLIGLVLGVYGLG